MKDKVIFFILGTAIGSATTYFITKKIEKEKFEKRITGEVDNRVNAEIAKYKEDCKKETDGTDESPHTLVDPKNPTKKPDIMEYHKQVFENHKYTAYSDSENKALDDRNMEEKVRIIPASEIPYGIEDEIIRYKYWEDGTVTDSEEEPLTDKEIEGSCGFEFQDYFGKDPEEPDIVYVKRGDKYYEITMEARRFDDLK